MDDLTRIELRAAASVGNSDAFSRHFSVLVSNVNAPLDDNGSCALICAAKGGHRECVQFLLRHGAAVDVFDNEASTPLLEAVISDHTAVVWELLQAKADPNLCDKDGTSPLHWAAYFGGVDCVRSLLFHNANPMVRDDDGTPEETATAKAHSECALLLKCASHVLGGGALPQVTVNVANRLPAPVAMHYVTWRDPREQVLGQMDPSSDRSGVVTVGDEIRLYSSSGERLTTHLVQPTPDPQMLICDQPATPTIPTVWEWEDGPVGSGIWRTYDGSVASKIATAVMAGRTQLDVSMGGRTPPDVYTIDLGAQQQHNHRTGFVRTLRPYQIHASGQAAVLARAAALLGAVGRSNTNSSLPLASSLVIEGVADRCTLSGFPGAYNQPPPYWGQGVEIEEYHGGAHTKLRTLLPTSPIFQEVLSLVASTGQDLNKLHVSNIYLAENAVRLNQYMAQKDGFQQRPNSTDVGERWMWHGAEKSNVPSILANGFLRDFNERAVYGKGVYFATEASYSLSTVYAKPDPETGDQYIMLVRVLVGEACVGRSSMDRPSQKPDSVELYDSMVDNVQKPRIVVLSAGSDNRAYPEFVLRVQRVR